jgi:BNR repeat-like domain
MTPSPAGDAVSRVIAADRFQYSSHPHCVRVGEAELLVVFNQSIRREVVHHPPTDPLVRNYTTRSLDGGQTWSAPRVAPDYCWSGVECAGLTALAGSEVLLNQWRFQWYPLEEGAHGGIPADARPGAEISGYAGMASGRPMPWARADGGAYVHRSADGGRTWAEPVCLKTEPYSGGYGIRGAIELPDGELLLPLNDVPAHQVVFGVRSPDAGRSWGPATLISEAAGKRFDEPALVMLADGSVLAMLREATTDHLHQCRSVDGVSWSRPEDSGITGCPPHLLMLGDGRLLCTYGYRYFPFEIRCVMSDDGGLTWNQPPIVVRSGLGSMDLGYPSSVELEPGKILAIYYGQLLDGTTAIMSTEFVLPD